MPSVKMDNVCDFSNDNYSWSLFFSRFCLYFIFSKKKTLNLFLIFENLKLILFWILDFHVYFIIKLLNLYYFTDYNDI